MSESMNIAELIGLFSFQVFKSFIKSFHACLFPLDFRYTFSPCFNFYNYLNHRTVIIVYL